MSARRTIRSLGLTFTIAVAVVSVAMAGSGGNCLSVNMPNPISLPDGSVHAAGSLMLCMSKAFSPVASLHEVWLDGMPFGVLLSRLGVSEAPGASQPTVTFRRDPGGLLHLIGYAWPSGGRTRTYLLDGSSSRRTAGREQARAGEGSIAVLAAARID